MYIEFRKIKMNETKNNTTHKDRDSGRLRHVVVRNAEIDSQELFQSERQLLIRHGAVVYRLRVTSQNKLILTK